MNKLIIVPFIIIVLLGIAYATDCSYLNDAIQYYSFDDADLSGTVLTDLAGTANADNNGATTGGTGVLGESFSCDGNNDYVDTNYKVSTIVWDEFTLNMWVKTTTSTLYPFLYGTYKANTEYVGIEVNTLSLNQIYFIFAGTTSGALKSEMVVTTANTTWRDGNWHMFTWVKSTNDRLNNSIYLDGYLMAYSSANDLNPADAPVPTVDAFICARSIDGSPSGYTQVEVDEFSLYDYAWTATDVANALNGGSACNPYAAGPTPQANFNSTNWDGALPNNKTSTNANINFYFNVTVDNIDTMNCTLYDDSVANKTITSESTTGNKNITYIISPDEETHLFNITCWDSTNISRIATSSQKSILVDVYAPTAVINIPVDSAIYTNAANITLNATCEDINLYEAELNCTDSSGADKWYEYASGIGGGNYSFFNVSDSTGWGIGNFSCTLRCGDDHNPIWLSPSMMGLEYTQEGINLTFAKKDKKVKIKPSSTELNLANTGVKVKVVGEQAYKVEYNYSLATTPKTSYKTLYDLESDSELILLDKTTGHFITGNDFDRITIDFRTEVEAGAKVTLKQVNDTYWIVTLDSKNMYIDPYVGNNNIATDTNNFTIGDSVIPTLNFEEPTPENMSTTGNNSFYVNVSSNESIDYFFLEMFNDTLANYSMVEDTTLLAHINLTDLANGTYMYRGCGNDTFGNLGCTGYRNVTVAYFAQNDILGIIWDSPTANANHSNSSMVEYSVNVSCYSTSGSCSVNVSLDPQLELHDPDTEIIYDTFGLSNSPTVDIGGYAALFLKGDPVLYYIPIMMFNISAIPAGQQIDDAELWLYVYSHSINGTETFTIYPSVVYEYPLYNISDLEWVEGNDTFVEAVGAEFSYNSRPTTSSQYNNSFDYGLIVTYETLSASGTGEPWLIINITNVIQYAYGKGLSNSTVYLYPYPHDLENLTDAEFRIYSKEYYATNNSLTPYLYINYSESSTPTENTTKGLIPACDATPFCTDSDNPYNGISINSGESIRINWTVNATGQIGYNYTFFANVTLATGGSVRNATDTINITITAPEAGPAANISSSAVVKILNNIKQWWWD